MDFNSAQLKAVRHKDGPMMVLAGPGSGKTTVLTERLRFLTEEENVPPESILVLTFSRAAAEEMRRRYEEKSRDKTGRICFGTFHSVFFAILTEYGGYTRASIADEGLRRAVIRELLQREGESVSYSDETAEAILSEISFVKNTGLSPLEVPEEKLASLKKMDFLRIFEGYERRLREQGKLDFDDMLTKCLELFNSRPRVLEGLRKRYRYILVDEFQDINSIQYKAVRLLAYPLNNLFIVGDDDQSIYSFRGSDPSIMLNFPKDYKDLKSVLLASNYRSSSKIVDISSKLISHNKNRYKKKLISERGGASGFEVLSFENEEEETEHIAGELLKLKKSGKDLSEVCVLYRTNRTPERLCARLIKAGLEFSLRESCPNLFHTFSSRDIFAYLYFAELFYLYKRGVKKEVAAEEFIRIMNRPVRYISRAAVASSDRRDVKAFFDSLSSFYGEKTEIRRSIGRLYADLEELAELPPQKAIFFINKKIGYEDWVIDSFESEKKSEILKDIDSLRAHAKGIKSFRDLRAYAKEYSLRLEEASRRKKEKSKNCINFMTFHASKGLEFDIVYIIDAIEGVTPYKKASEKDMEEERRMFYVAMTRARNVLHIFYTKSHYNKPCKRSRFVSEITEGKIKLPWKSLRF